VDPLPVNLFSVRSRNVCDAHITQLRIANIFAKAKIFAHSHHIHDVKRAFCARSKFAKRICLEMLYASRVKKLKNINVF